MPGQISIDHMLGESPEYDAFVEKFKPKLTTDDCYTPQQVYDAVADWVANTYGLDRSCFVRPFFPGGDFENYPYPTSCVVVDNPPFSIMQKIINFYCRRGIKFMLFAPALVGLANGIEDKPATILAAGCAITYENGALVNTSFVTNLETEYIVRSCPDLCQAVAKANAEARAVRVKHVPKYKYPNHVATLSQFNYFSAHDTFFGVRRGDAVRISAMDEQRQCGKTCFGGGLLLSHQAAAKKAAAKKAAAIEWNLSDREMDIVCRLSK